MAQLTGSITDEQGRPQPELNVLLFPTDPGLWAVARRIKSVRVSDAGTYTITGVPDGEYYLCALTELDRQVMQEPEYLQQLIPASFKITLSEGDRKVQNLKVQ